MLFGGIDQHKRHLTICVRDEQGEIGSRRQVSTKDRAQKRTHDAPEPQKQREPSSRLQQKPLAMTRGGSAGTFCGRNT